MSYHRREIDVVDAFRLILVFMLAMVGVRLFLFLAISLGKLVLYILRGISGLFTRLV